MGFPGSGRPVWIAPCDHDGWVNGICCIIGNIDSLNRFFQGILKMIHFDFWFPYNDLGEW